MIRPMLAVAVVFAATAVTRAVDPPPPPARTPGLTLHVYDVGPMNRLQWLIPGQTPNHARVITALHLDGPADFGGDGLEDEFLAEARGFLKIPSPGLYAFELRSDDGSALFLDDVKVLDHDGLHGDDLVATTTVELPAGESAILVRMFERRGGESLRLRWKPPGASDFSDIPADALFTQANQVHVTSPGRKKLLALVTNTRPGDGQPLEAVHPAFAISNLHTDEFQPRVGGIDFLPDGRLVVCTWDPRGEVFLIEHPDDPARRRITPFASGLAEPLGVTVVDGEIYVLQKQELTKLIDHDRDGVADEYRCIADGWPVSANFHEFAFGLAYADGHFYANLAVAIDPGGRTTVPQPAHDPRSLVGRGQVVRIDPDSGRVEPVAMGVRTPNGIGVGPDGGIFVTDNQGDWLPCSKMVKIPVVGKGAAPPAVFFGAHTQPDHAWADRSPTPPVVWLPQGEIGNSPGQPVALRVGPWKGQMLHGDVTHGGLKRTFIETVGGVDQGCVFRFSQGFNGGVNRLAWGPDGSLYVGQIGSTGNWGQRGKQWFGLQRLTYHGEPVFEPLAVRAEVDGFTVAFTEPLAEGLGFEPTHYHVEHWRYEPSNDYGGEKLGQETLAVREALVSTDRKSVRLRVDGLREGHVVYLRLADLLRGESGRRLWTTEAWYTLNRKPVGERQPFAALPAPRHNTLTDAERSSGWKLLFDGASLDGWRAYGSEAHPPVGWEVIDGALTRATGGGDIMTADEYGDFELSLEWKIAEAGNSGIFLRVDPAAPAAWHTGVEMQVLDNARHPDGRDPRTSAGACYGLIAPPRDTSLGAERWNHARIVANGSTVTYFLNGEEIVAFNTASPEWNRLVGESKFKDLPRFSAPARGRIVLQDHGDRVQYRNVKVRPITP